MDIRTLAAQAKTAAIAMAGLGTDIKNRALAEIAAALERRQADIVAANRSDLDRSEKENLAPPLLKRLKFDAAKIDEACAGLRIPLLIYNESCPLREGDCHGNRYEIE